MLMIIDDPNDPATREVVETLRELQALGLVVLEENDVGELCANPTAAGREALASNDDDPHEGGD